MEINRTAGVAYSEITSAVVTTNALPTRPRVSDENSQLEGKVVPWGDDNLFPQNVLKECRKNTIIGTTLDKQARIAIEGGIAYGNKVLKDGKVVFEEVIDQRVEAFLRRSQATLYQVSAYRNFYWFYNCFPELILSKDRKQIVTLKNQKTAYCRWGAQNSNGVVERCYISAQWEDVLPSNLKGVAQLPVIDIYADPKELQSGKASNYIYPISYPTEDESFYSLTDWNSLRESGWLEVAQAIPEFKKMLFKNQLNIKYHIEISSHWWNWRYPGFDTFKEKKKKELMALELKNFEEKMKGNDQAGNSIMTSFFSDPAFSKEYAGWRINTIDNKIKDGIYNQDSNEASSHLLYAIGMDSSLIGVQPGAKIGAGSGSDKRVAFNIYSDLIKPHQQIVLAPFHFIAEYNDWVGEDGMPFHFWQRNLKDPKIVEAPKAGNEESVTEEEETQQQAS